MIRCSRVKKLEKKIRSRTHKLKRLYKVGLTARVESFDSEESLGEDASKQGRIDAIDADEEITMVSVQNVDEEMFDVNILDGEEVFVAEQEVAANKVNDEVNVVEDVSTAGNVVSTASDATAVSAATTTTDDDGDITLAQALIEMKSTKSKNKRLGNLIKKNDLQEKKLEKERSHIALIAKHGMIYQEKIDADHQ
ncbi:hypothetical protein Tco_0281159 [Tanacetum coccineum]